MLEPVAVNDILIAVMAGALTVLFGALYALFFALGKLRGSRLFMALSLLSYGALGTMVTVLAIALHLTGFWQALTAALLLGYLVAPQAIWHLCVATHEDEPAAPAPEGEIRP